MSSRLNLAFFAGELPVSDPQFFMQSSESDQGVTRASPCTASSLAAFNEEAARLGVNLRADAFLEVRGFLDELWEKLMVMSSRDDMQEELSALFAAIFQLGREFELTKKPEA